MNFTPAAILKQITEFWNKQNRKTKTIIISAGVIVIVIAIVASVLLNNKPYDVLYRGLSSSEGAEILTKLEGMSVDAKVESDGTIRVPSDKVAKLKMQLASEGYP
ncbi:MAG: flagellar M-ring protein FliF, partial [Bacillota bacterium]|nr:flagellar M-ring protein FliF [Bacillota bacterium]